VTGNGKILSLSEQGGKKDAHGRLLKHNATVQEVHEIAIEEHSKVHEFYLNQVPDFVARMITDALIGYGLLVPPPGTDIVPQIETATREDDRIDSLFGVSPASVKTRTEESSTPAEPRQ
jgi:hypothetical protein